MTNFNFLGEKRKSTNVAPWRFEVTLTTTQEEERLLEAKYLALERGEIFEPCQNKSLPNKKRIPV